MKLNQLALAVAAACAAAPAFALTPAQIDGTTVQLWISGATAPTASVYKGVAKLCVDANANGVADDLHVYVEKDVTGSPRPSPGRSVAGKYVAYACTMGPLAGASLDGMKTVVYHTFDGGSFEAYTPHLWMAGEVNALVPNNLKRMKPMTGSTTCVLDGTNEEGYPQYDKCGSVAVTLATNVDQFSVPTLPQGGFSDTEYTLNKLNLNITKSLGDIGGEAPTNVGQGFGLAVSHALYFQLQQQEIAQDKLAITCDDAPATATAPNLTAACQPNVNRQEYSSLASAGGVTNKSGSLFGAAAITPIQVQRRAGTSGTQSSSNAFFLNAPCASGEPLGALTPSGTNAGGTFGSLTNPPVLTSYNGGKALVYTNNGSGDVKSALTAASNAGQLAIGVLSLENVPNPGAAVPEKFAFVKLNGVSPTFTATGAIDPKQRENAIAGDYEFWYELVGFTASSAFQEGIDLIENTKIALGDPTITDLTGLFVTKAAGVTGTNVSKGFKFGNACAPAIQ